MEPDPVTPPPVDPVAPEPVDPPAAQEIPFELIKGFEASAFRRVGPLGRLMKWIRQPGSGAMLVSLVVAAFTAWQSKVLYDQLVVMNDQTQAMKAQTTEMRRQNDLVKKQLEVADRPWIEVVSVAAPRGIRVSFAAERRSIVFPPTLPLGEITLKNHGRSVATRIRIGTTKVIDGSGKNWGRILVPEALRKLCEMTKTVMAEESVIFPDQEVVREMPSWQDSAHSLFNPNSSQLRGIDSPSPYTVHLVGCVYYQFHSSSDLHETRFVFTALEDGKPIRKPIDNVLTIEKVEFRRVPEHDFAN
jgi:hypothetical protein